VIARPRIPRSIGSIACCALASLAVGCSSSDDAGKPDDTARPAAVVCDGVDEVNQDDDGAVQALLPPSQLPPGEWTTAETPPCPWALSADELLRVPECRSAAAAAGSPANDETRNGNARVTFTGAGDTQLDDRIEIYTSRQNVDAIRAMLAGTSMPACYTAALHARATDEPRMAVRDARVSRFSVHPDAAALGLGFPAAAGYPADPGFADGVDITFTKTTRGASTPVAMRVITFGSGGLMSTVTLIGATPADLDTIDLTGTLRNAAANFTGIFNPNG